MTQIARDIAPSKRLNYARNTLSGKVIHFRGYWKPLRPSQWASWFPVPGVPEMRLIGESELVYRLRCRTATGCNEAPGLLAALQQFDADSDEWQAAWKAGSALTSLARGVRGVHANEEEEPE